MRNSSETCKQDSFRKEDWDEDISSLVSETAMFIWALQNLSRFSLPRRNATTPPMGCMIDLKG